MKSQLKWLATATCAVAWSVYSYATEITVDNFTAVQSVTGNNGGNYTYFQFALGDSRMATSGGSALADEVVVSKIAVGQRNPANNQTYSIAVGSWLLIQEVTTLGTDNLGGTLGVSVATTAPLTAEGKTANVTVGTGSKTLTLCTWTLTTPVRLSKSKTYRATFYNASKAPENQQLEMVTISGRTNSTNTKIHASGDANYSPYVRVTVTDEVVPAVGVAKSATLTENGTWAELPWNPEGAPVIADTVALSAYAARTVTLTDKVTISGLTLSGTGPFNFAAASGQAPMLIAYATEVNADTDVSAITHLGAVTLASGKTLTVAPSVGYGSLTSGTSSSGANDASKVIVNAKTSAFSVGTNDTRSAALKNFTGVVEFQGSGSTGATVEFGYANSGQAFKPRFIFNGGTHTMKYGCNDNLFSPGGTDEKPTISVTGGAALTFTLKDLSGWSGSTGTTASVIRVGTSSTLELTKNTDDNTGYFRDRILLDSNASVTNSHSKFYFYGGTSNLAQLAMLKNQGTATWNGGFETKGDMKIDIGSDSTLKLNGVVSGTHAVTKAGAGTLTLTGANTKSGTLTISAGTVKLQDAGSWAGAIANSGTLEVANATDKTLSNAISGAGKVKKTGTGTLSLRGTMSSFTGSVEVAAGALEVQVADAATKTIANTLSGAGTVKKSGAGALSLTGKVSTPVEVAAGTLDIGTSRPSLKALVSDATLKLTATTAEVAAGAVVLPTTLEAAPDKARFSVVDGSGATQTINSVSVANGLLVLALPVSEPTFTVTDESEEGEGAWAVVTEWPNSGNVTISANQLTEDKEVTIPAPTEGTRALTQVTVVGNTTAKVTLVVESGVTIATLVPYGYVRVDVATVNALTTAPVVPAGATLEVVAERDTTLGKAISGAGTFAKGGAGVLTLGANITTTSGSIVQKGTLKFSSTGYVNASNYNTATGDVTVGAGATLDLNGIENLNLRTITLAEDAIYQNSGSGVGAGKKQLQGITLTGNATVKGDSDFGLVASGWGATTLNLGGYTLTKEGSGNFWLMNTTVDGASGKIVVEAGSVTNTGENKAVTFSTPITLESTLTGTPFNLTGYDVTASDDLTANGPVSFATLRTGSGKTIAGTGTVTVTDMGLGGPLNVTGNLVIDRTSATRTREFANAIKVASGGSLTTKGDITWSSSDNEFLGSLTVASGTLTIKTPDQKLGGNVTIASDATLTIAKTVITTTTGVITGGGKLVIGDGSTASSVTLNGTLGTVTVEGASALATHSSPIEIGLGSKLIFNSATPTVLTNAAISGDGSLTIAGSSPFTFGEGSNSSYSGATLVEQGATLVLNCANKKVVSTNTEVGVLTAETAETSAVTVNGTLKGIQGAFYRQVKGSGKILVPSAGALTIGRDNSGVTGIVSDIVTGFTGNIEVERGGTLSLPSWSNSVTHAVANCNITNDGKIEGGGQGGTTTVTISNGKTLKGSGEILPNVTFETGGLLDVSQDAPTLSVVSGPVTVKGHTKAVQPVLKTASVVTFAEIPDYTLPKSGMCYWLVKDTAKTLSAVAPASEDAIRWSALPWKSSDAMAVSPEIFALGLNLTAEVSAAADMTYVALDMAATPCSTIDLTLSGSNRVVFYEGTETAEANFKSLTVKGSAIVEIAALNNVAGDDVTVSGWLYPLDSGETVTPLTKPLTGDGTVAVFQNKAVTIASTLGSVTDDEATFQGNLAVASGATLTLTSPIRQKVLGSIICLDTGRLVIGNGSQASGLVFTGRFGAGETSTLGGTLAISANSYFTFASASAATVTGAVVAGTSGTGRLTLGDGSKASTLTLAGTLGSVADGVATYAGSLEVAAGSELHLKPSLATTLSSAITGAGKVVVGDGSAATQVSLAALRNDIAAIDILAWSTLTVDAAAVGTALPATATVDIAEHGKLVINTAREMNANVTGAGEVEANAITTYAFKSGQTNCLAPGKLTVTKALTLHAERAGTELSVGELCVQAALTSTNRDGIAKPVVRIANRQVLSGGGSIIAPITFEKGAIFDAKDSEANSVLSLTEADITWPASGTVTVKASEAIQLMQFASEVGLDKFTLTLPAEITGLCLAVAKGKINTAFALSVVKQLTAVDFPMELADKTAVQEAIQQEVAKLAADNFLVNKITAVTAKNTAGDAMGSVQAIDCFTNLETTVSVEPDWKGGDYSKGIATITYDFGVSDITIKEAQLDSDAAPQLYVLACAKVSNGKAEEKTAADYATGTTVTLLLDGAEATGTVAIDKVTLSEKFKVTAGTGERWFALPLKGLKLGTRKFTVSATNTTQAEVTP